MASAVNAGARLDRLPISSFHYRIFALVGAGMFFDGYDLYVAGGVLASAIQTKFSTLPQNLQFLSLTFVGMTRSLITGYVGDKVGRRFTYQSTSWSSASPRSPRNSRQPQLIVLHASAPRAGRRIVVSYSTGPNSCRQDARPLARLHGLHRRRRFPGHGDPQLFRHPDLGLAADVRHRRHRLAHRLVSAQEFAGVAALAGMQGRTAEAEAFTTATKTQCRL